MTDLLNNKQIRHLIPGILLTGLLILSFLVLREFLLALVWAIIIVYVMWPPYQWLRRKLRGRTSLSAAVMTVVIAAVIFLTIYWLAAMLQNETKTAYQSLADAPGSRFLSTARYYQAHTLVGQLLTGMA